MERRQRGYEDTRAGRRPGGSADRRSGSADRGRSGSRYSDKGSAGRRSSGSRRPSGAKRRRRRRNRRSLMYGCMILFLLLLVACAAGTLFLYKKNHPKKLPVPKVSVDLESLDSPYAVLLDADSGSVIGSKRGGEVIYPASMTKILTVLTAIEQIRDLKKTVTMSYDYYDMLYEQDASRAGFEPGEEAVIRDLLYGALLPSGAECCMQLAIEAAGSQDAFVEKMNQKVESLGLQQTHFANVTGLHSEDQYTTPYEMGEILADALKNKTFREVFTTPSYTVGPTNVHPDGFTFQSSMFKNMASPTVINGEIKGGKTGYTQAAGHCLASMAEVGGRPYILVTAGWAQNPRVEQYHINDAFIGYNLLGRAVEAE